VTSKQRFWAKVNKTADCWLWTDKPKANGYGRLMVNGRAVSAHRYSWTLHYGAIPLGQVVRHRCDTPRCVRPEHLELGSQADNVADMVARKRTAVGERASRSRLSESQVAALRAFTWHDLLTYAELAPLFDITPSSMGDVMQHKSWRGVR
jgi:hypothetical protein